MNWKNNYFDIYHFFQRIRNKKKRVFKNNFPFQLVKHFFIFLKIFLKNYFDIFFLKKYFKKHSTSQYLTHIYNKKVKNNSYEIDLVV